MAETAFFDDAARASVRDAIADVERHTSAEVVVAVHKISGAYGDVDCLAGFGLAYAVLLLLLFLPQEFETAGMPLEVLVAFVLGAWITHHAWAVRRRLVTSARKRRAVAQAARAAFVDGGISRTSGRTGVLVFVSMFERLVEVVPDIGVAAKDLGPEWRASLEELERAVAEGADFPRFLVALRRLGPVLGGPLPRQPDDVNELADEPVMA